MDLTIKIIIVIALFGMIFNLFRAMFVMLRQTEDAPPMSKFIGKRLLFAVFLVLALLLSLGFGWLDLNPRPY